MKHAKMGSDSSQSDITNMEQSEKWWCSIILHQKCIKPYYSMRSCMIDKMCVEAKSSSQSDKCCSFIRQLSVLAAINWILHLEMDLAMANFFETDWFASLANKKSNEMFPICHFLQRKLSFRKWFFFLVVSNLSHFLWIKQLHWSSRIFWEIDLVRKKVPSVFRKVKQKSTTKQI